MIRNKLLVLIMLLSANVASNASLDLSFVSANKENNSLEDQCFHYERLNPAIYIVNVDCRISNYVLSFKELFHAGWKVYFSLKSSEEASNINYSFNCLLYA